jgi:hypothetical protein
MIVHPLLEPLETVPGTRLLVDHFDLVGRLVLDPTEPRRDWRIHGFYAPLGARAIGGIRARLVDQKGFVSFLNQRDLEVLLGLGQPGARCGWLGRSYVAPDHPDWIGPCADDEDLADDLVERSLTLHAQHLILVPPMDLPRRIHEGPRDDHEELQVLVAGDGAPVRWARAERRRVRWELV